VSKKKSYMNHKSVLLENKLLNAFKFLVGLNQLKKQKLSSKEKQALKNPKIQKLVKGFYKDIEKANKLADELKADLKKQGYGVED
jgi:hypothetical protein|tara:strand:+ start:1044 stop:1298 length:255 start_codon:yes stop_codon:yes gene_type:complete